MISSAFAQSAAGGAGGFSLQGLLPFVLIFIIILIKIRRTPSKNRDTVVENEYQI